MKVLLLLMLSTGTGWSYDAVPVSSVDECKKTASNVVKYMASEGHITTFGKSASFICIDANTGKELVKRTYMNKKGQPK
jgi:hypothetical protein